MFNNPRFITTGIHHRVDPLLQFFIWRCIDDLEEPQDYLQVFTISAKDGYVKLVHTQENPTYSQEYLVKTDAPVFVGKIYVIDDGDHSTMLLAEEY